MSGAGLGNATIVEHLISLSSTPFFRCQEKDLQFASKQAKNYGENSVMITEVR